jgi:ketosteroid isomerase-like protein
VSNIQTVQAIYAAFGQGDIPTILGHLGENVEWEYGTLDAGVPWLQPRRGLTEVPKFFESLGALDFQRFQPKTFLESGNVVVALIDFAVVVKANGRSIVEEDEVHIWHFDNQGRVIRFCHRLDTHKHWLALREE